METRQERQKAQLDETGDYTPRKLSFAENAKLTIKVLAGFGLLGAALWGISVWTAVK